VSGVGELGRRSWMDAEASKEKVTNRSEEGGVANRSEEKGINRSPED
jgi:hypothetical protein